MVLVRHLQEPHAAQAPHEQHGLRHTVDEGRASSKGVLCCPAGLQHAHRMALRRPLCIICGKVSHKAVRVRLLLGEHHHDRMRHAGLLIRPMHTAMLCAHQGAAAVMTWPVRCRSAWRVCPQGQPDERRLHGSIHVVTCSFRAECHVLAARVACLQNALRLTPAKWSEKLLPIRMINLQA